MLNILDLHILENISEKEFQKKSNLIVHTLIKNLTIQLEIEPYQNFTKFLIVKKEIPELNDVFSIGVNRYIQNETLVIEIQDKYIKFLPFIVLREIYKLFVPDELSTYESVQLVINQILMNDLSKYDALNEWRSLVRSHLEQYDLLSGGFNRLIAYDRLENYFKNQKISNNPTRFFFQYIRKNISIMSDKIENIDRDIHIIFFHEFEKYIWEFMIDDEVIETLRCLIEIFYKVKNYRDLESYKKYFQEFKENNQLKTELSLRKFVKNMELIKKSYIAPSYQLNRNAINVGFVISYFRFNPLLEKSKIFKIIETLPFFVSPQISRNSFSIDVLGYFIIPKTYLKDLTSFIIKLENFGYIIKSNFVIRHSFFSILNLNYFRENSQKYCIINPDHHDYESKFEIEFNMDHGIEFYETKLNLLEFLLLDRIRFFSVSGLGFERRSEILQSLKSDLINEIITQRAIIKKLKKSLNLLHTSVELKTEILRFIESNDQFGFFYIKFILEEILSLINIIEKILINNPKINSIYQLRDFLSNQYFSNSIQKSIKLNNVQLKDYILDEIFTLYFKSRNGYRKTVEKFKQFYEIFNLCYNLKLFNLQALKNIVINQNLVEIVYKTKEEKLTKSFEKWKSYKITNEEIDNVFNKILDHKPPIIKPILFDTITTGKYVKDYIHLLLINSQETQEFIEKTKIIFPLTVVVYIKDLKFDRNLIYIRFNIPNLTITEKAQLYSILYNNLKKNIQFVKSYLWRGIYPAISSRNFYDFTKKKFFYTKDLFKQYFLYIQKLLGKPLQQVQEKSTSHEKFWSREKNISNLIKKVNDRVLRENIDLNITHLNNLLDFNLNLEESLLDIQKFAENKKQFFFKNYIKSIKFLPNFQRFNLGQYFLYLYPTDMNELDFKLLLTNTFQKVKYPACIDNSNSLFIKYIIPHGAPQLKYLHWLTKSKKVIREYCGFFIKKVYQILHFSQNLSSEGWVYDKDQFKMHMQNILFKPDYNFQIPEIKEYNITDEFISSFLGPESPELESLSNIYNWHSIDIKSFLRTKKAKTVNHIINLLENGLIFPYLSLKNLDLHDKVYIIVPNLKPELNSTLVKIFSFFNFAFVYETEGEYYIYGFEQEEKFQNGLMIKIYFPKCEISEFMRLFDLLFEYLEIKDYLILNDLVDGKNLIKSIYGGLAFLDSYNPLKNLEWNEQDKIWQNLKIFTSKFKPIYPELISKEKR